MIESSTAVTVLSHAQEVIRCPDNWGKGPSRHRPNKCCAAEAVEHVIQSFRAVGTKTSGDDHVLAYRALYDAAGLDFDDDCIEQWNDATERTHSEVMSAFNIAISSLKAK